MAVFVELTTSPLESNFQRTLDATQGASNVTRRAGRPWARRPLRGLEIKEDTYATLTVRTADNKSIPLLDSGAPDGYNSSGYSNFILQSVSEPRMEKHQIIETFGASYVFFFGEQPRFLDCQAVLVNSHDFNWEAEWWANYNTYLRGTKLVEMGARCYMAYDDSVVEGYMMMANATKTSDQPLLVQLQFKFFVTNCTNVTNVGDPNFPVRSSVSIPANISLTSKDAGRQIVSNLRDEALGAAQISALDSAGALAANNVRGGVPGTYRTISQLVREMPPSFAVSADWWPVLQSRGPGNLAGLQRLVVREGKPIRGLIASNVDEGAGYIKESTQFGYEPGEQSHPPSALKPTTRGILEAQDLFRQASEFLSCHGVNIDNPTTFASLGFKPNFSATTQGSSSATFRPSFGASVGFTASAGVGASAVAGGNSGFGRVYETRRGYAASLGRASAQVQASFRSDPLGAVFGRRSDKAEFGRARQKIVETGADYSYGYESDFASEPGFGRVGFGDSGGNGFGSGLSSGDPGYKDPSRFTFAGVAEESSAFERFLRTKQDRTALTGGPVAGRGALTGGASIRVDGSVSAFALVSVGGKLDVTGNARSSAQFMSDARAGRVNGVGVDGSLGARCASPGTATLGSLGTGVNFSASASAGVGISGSARVRFGT